VIVIPKREVVRHGNRFIVYLPADYNDIWEELKREEKSQGVRRGHLIAPAEPNSVPRGSSFERLKSHSVNVLSLRKVHTALDSIKFSKKL